MRRKRNYLVNSEFHRFLNDKIEFVVFEKSRKQRDVSILYVLNVFLFDNERSKVFPYFVHRAKSFYSVVCAHDRLETDFVTKHFDHMRKLVSRKGYYVVAYVAIIDKKSSNFHILTVYFNVLTFCESTDKP